MILHCGGGAGAGGASRAARASASDIPRPSSSSRSLLLPLGSRAFRVSCISTRARPGPASESQSHGGALPSLLRRLASAGEPGAGVREILDPYADRLSPKELTVLLKSQRDWRRALQIFRWMRAQGALYSPNPIHYNVLIRALGRARRWDELRRCWADMAADGVPATHATYGVLVDVFGRAGLVREALLWLRHMRARGVFPDEVTMNTAVRVLKDAGEFDLGERLFADWCDARLDPDALLARLRPAPENAALVPLQLLLAEMFRCGAMPPPEAATDKGAGARKPRLAATFNTLIDLYGKAGRLGDASRVFAEMLRSGVAPDTTTFNTMISVCGAHGLREEAAALLEKMEQRRVRPDTKTFNVLMSLDAAAGDAPAVLARFLRLRPCGLRPDSVTQRIVLGALCPRAMVAEAERVIGELCSAGEPLDEQVLPLVARMYVEQGLLAEAADFFLKHCSGRPVGSKNYAAIANVYAERGLWREAELVFSSGGTRCKDLAEYNVMIKAYGRAGLFDRACELFERMPSLGAWPDECSYNSLIQMLAGGDRPERAAKMLQRMRSEAGMRAPAVETFSAVVASCARAKLPELAEEVFEGIRAAGLQPNEVAYGALVDALAGAGDAAAAHRRVEEMEAAGLAANRFVLTSLMKAQRKKGDWREAQKLYARIASTEGGADAAAGNCMLALYADLGMEAEARAVMADLRQRGAADAASYLLMVRLCRSMGLLGEAAAAAEQMWRAGLVSHSAAAGMAMAALAGAGRLRDCGQLLEEMLERGVEVEAGGLRSLLAAMGRAGAAPDAVRRQLEAAVAGGEGPAGAAIAAVVMAAVGIEEEAVRRGEALVGAAELPAMFSCNAAMWAFAAAGETGRALNLYMRVQDEGRAADVATYVALARCYGGAGFVEGLNRIYAALKHGHVEPDRSLYVELTAAYGAAGRPDLADVAEQEMRFALSEHPDETNRAQS
ncbi:pentatricopeptide repeat (PPR) superfamily protein [Wolffia australiana]